MPKLIIGCIIWTSLIITAQAFMMAEMLDNLDYSELIKQEVYNAHQELSYMIRCEMDPGKDCETTILNVE